MTLEERLDNYTDAGMFTLRKSKGSDGLTGKQRRRLLHKKNRIIQKIEAITGRRV
jgi:hypothetical protein